MNAMILAAGRGERLRPITDSIPKPLVMINGKSPMRKHLEGLDKAGFSKVVINVAHLGFKICKEFGNQFGKNISIRYSFEPLGALETAGGIAFAEPWDIPNEPFLVINSDIWSDWDLNQAYEMRKIVLENDLWGCLIMVKNSEDGNGDYSLDISSKLYDKFNLLENTKSKFEKLTFSGIGVYTSRMFESVVRGKPTALKNIFDYGISRNLIIGKKHDGVWIDIGTHKSLNKLRSQSNKLPSTTSKIKKC